MANFLSKLFGTKAERDLKELNPLLQNTLVAYEDIKQLTNDELRGKTVEFKEKIAEYIREEEERINEIKDYLDANYDLNIAEKEDLYRELENLEKKSYKKTQEILEEILPEAFSVMKETARRFKENEYVEVTATDMDRDIAAYRECIEITGDKAKYHNSWMAGGNMITWDMCHYDVQLIGGIVLHQGRIAEMATGEGKTLVATLPVYLNALPGKGVHVVTVNDYLAKRDSEWMGLLYEFHGLSVDCIDKHEPNSEERRQAYLADITYGTNNEFGFDYLRDNMARNITELVQRPHNFAIVDEVDSVLIDDARTPLIISGPTPRGDKQEFDNYKPIVEKLYNAQKALITEVLTKAKNLLKENPDPKPQDEAAILLLRAHRGLPKNKALIKFLSEPGIKQVLLKTESFFMQEQNKNMHIIDDELYFVIEEKQNTVDIMEKGIQLVSRNAEEERLFIIPDIGAEIAELEKQNLDAKTKLERKNDIYRNFSIASERIHTIHQLMKAYTMFEKDVEYVIIDNKVKIVDEQTGRIMEGRRYSDGLHQAIEAKENVKVEAATQTYATITLQNYFRMYKKLSGMTGTAETEAGEFWNIYKLDVVVIPTNRDIIRDDAEDLVYKTKREKYAAVVDKILELNAEGRPVLVGTTSVETSELFSKILTARRIKHNVLNAKLHKKEADIVAEAGQAGTVTISTNMAGRGTDIKLTPEVREKGGLAIIGTERHDSRRVDRQLRGRAGRQGDPGSSQFFVSLEDDLMRLFGSDRIARVMDRIGLKDGEVIQHGMITKSIERAQKKVEENNFGIRKRLLEYDDVMNKQRETIYRKRRNALFGDRLSIDLSQMFYDVCYQVVEANWNAKDYEGFVSDLLLTFGCESPFESAFFLQERVDKLVDQLYPIVWENYQQKIQQLSEKTYPVVERVYLSEGHRYQNIAIPITDGVKTLNVVAPLKKCYETKGREIGLSIEKSITLAVIDNAWKEHLREMDDLKQTAQNASYEQKDPLLIYKLESFALFDALLQRVNEEIVSFLTKGDVPIAENTQLKEAKLPESEAKKLQTGRQEVGSGRQISEGGKGSAPIRVEKKVGRNEPCPCGSGKKYKQCHGRAG
ncbi:MAG TPA: preprotein translocase subunit SecA [Bacteroidales bacterium]|jgi:preprotein translocase subunit SecA|nr:preprotein translocase subunit SecA [Bacteroidales bacterium]HPY80852.1 preprotein translocase subunit SecA [Bacteroidales bacterium]HRT13997.1 preprotein translocase subunit SecA [Bacteroidales bacterium]